MARKLRGQSAALNLVSKSRQRERRKWAEQHARKTKKKETKTTGGRGRLVIFMKLRVTHPHLTFKFVPCQMKGEQCGEDR